MNPPFYTGFGPKLLATPVLNKSVQARVNLGFLPKASVHAGE